VSVSQSGQLAISSFRSGRVSLRSQAHGDEVNTVALARDDRTLVTGANDGVVKIWDLPTLRRTVKQPRHLGRVVGIGVVNGGKQIISGGMDGFLCLWDAKTGKFQHRFGSRSRVIRQVNVTPDGHHVVFLSSVRPSSPAAAGAFSDDRSRLHVLDLGSGQEWNTLTTTQEWDNRLAVSPVDGTIVAVTNETDVSFFSRHELKPTATVRNVAYHIYNILVAPDGSRVLVRGRGADDYTGNRNVVLNLRSGKPEASLRGSQGILAFRNARQLWLRGIRRKLRLWDLGIRKTVWTSAFPGGELRAARVSEDGRRAIFLGADDAMIVWDLVHDKRLATLEGNGNEVEGVDFWPGREFALTISRDHSLGVWDWRRGRRLASFTASDRISCYRVLPEPRVVVIGDICGGVHFLRLEGIAA
jgi:WD40 repeat protein